MDHYHYQENALYCEDVSIADIAKEVGTPCYIYSRATLERHWHAFDNALTDHPHKICYAVKANSNLAILKLLADLGSGFDVVSVGELERVLLAGGLPDNIVFSGVGKQAHEIKRALEVGIHCLNIESVPELDMIVKVAHELGVVAPIAVRVNPDIDAKTHPYISTGLKENKFGITVDEAFALYQRAATIDCLRVVGIDCHIGSQLTTTKPFLDALDRLLTMVDALAAQGIELEHIDIGGGLGVCYQDETPPHPAEYAKQVLAKLKPRMLSLYMEPGRAIAANIGIMVTRVLFKKNTEAKKFLLVDGAMNDLLRPALYQAWHNIIPVMQHVTGDAELYDIVGPVCETGDFLGKDRELVVRDGDYLAVRGAGAYGFVMSSQYNTRPRAAEVLVSGNKFYVIRQRESIADCYQHEVIPNFDE